MTKYYVYEKREGVAGVSTEIKNLPLIGEADNMDDAERILKEYLINKFRMN